MKKVHKLVIAGSIVTALAVAAAVPWTYWDTSVRKQLANQVRHTTGLELTTSGDVTVALLPRPHIKIRSVSIRDRWNTLKIDTEILKANLRLLPLATGRLEVSSISLYLPTIALNAHARPLHDRGAIARASAAAKSSPQAKTADSIRLATINIAGGRMLIKGEANKNITQIGDINATLDWTQISKPARFSGDFIWHGEKVALDASFSDPGELLREQSSPARIDVKSRLLQLALDGRLTAARGWQYMGTVKASSEAIRPLLSVFGAEWPIPATVSTISLAGKLNARPGSMSLTGLTISVDNSEFAGALAVLVRGQRPLVTATLATDSLAIDHRATNLPRLRDTGGKWSKAPLPLKQLELTDIDLRMSAKSAKFNALSAENVAIVAIVRNGSVELSVSSPKAYHGNFRAAVSMAQGPALPALSGSINFNGIDSGSLLADMSSRFRAAGAASGELQFRSAGNNFSDIASLLSGKLKVRVLDGFIAGLDIVQALDLAKSQPLSIPDRIRFGSTPVVNADILATIKDGRLNFQDTQIDSGTIHSAVTGNISLPARHLDLAITSTRKEKGKNKSATPQSSLALDILGPWNRPSIAPNPESLIMRSKAAEPLLPIPQPAKASRAASAKPSPVADAAPAAAPPK